MRPSLPIAAPEHIQNQTQNGRQWLNRLSHFMWPNKIAMQRKICILWSTCPLAFTYETRQLKNRGNMKQQPSQLSSIVFWNRIIDLGPPGGSSPKQLALPAWELYRSMLDLLDKMLHHTRGPKRYFDPWRLQSQWVNVTPALMSMHRTAWTDDPRHPRPSAACAWLRYAHLYSRIEDKKKSQYSWIRWMHKFKIWII